MKKSFITLIAILAISTSVMADGHVDSVRYLTTKAWKNWFVSAEGSIDWWQGSDLNPNGNYTAVQWGKPSFGAGLSVGKWLTHSLGFRLAYDVNGGKSYIDNYYPNRAHSSLYLNKLASCIHEKGGQSPPHTNLLLFCLNL